MEGIITEKDIYKKSRLLYIIEATLEYFISMAFTEVYICRLTAFLGFSDSMTGILTGFVSLGATFQILALFIGKERNVKGMVTAGHIISQLFFCLCYFIPYFSIAEELKIVLFIGILLSAYLIHNAIHPFKIAWYMSLVDNKKRGRFTATKEIVSLISGMAFSYLLGWIVDSNTIGGEVQTVAFLIIGLMLVGFTVFHSITLVFSKEKKETVYNKKTSAIELGKILLDKKLLLIIPISIIWSFATHISRPFMGTYQKTELGFTAQISSIIIIVASFTRALISRPFGKFADKYTFTNMLIVCMGIEAVAFIVMALATPVLHTEFLYVIFYVLYSVGMAGINSATINLYYDYVDKDKITRALAIKTSVAGIIGFIATLLASPVVSAIQANDNQIFGMTIYAQQLLSFLSSLIIVGIILYLIFVVKKANKNKDAEMKMENGQS